MFKKILKTWKFCATEKERRVNRTRTYYSHISSLFITLSHAMPSHAIYRYTVWHSSWKYYEGDLCSTVLKYIIQFKRARIALQYMSPTGSNGCSGDKNLFAFNACLSQYWNQDEEEETL